ncbi:MAG: ATP-binding protein [Chromatiaceae bacterium]
MGSRAGVSPTLLQSLPLRLGALFVALLITAALGVGYLFDRGRSEALQQRSLSFLRLHGERAADDLQRRLERLQRDTLFLAQTPAVRGLCALLEHGAAAGEAGQMDLAHWRKHLQQLFLAFAESRPEYIQLRLIAAGDGGRELVRIERVDGKLLVTPDADLQRKGERYYVRRAASLPAGEVYLSRFDLNREHGQIQVPHVPTVRAATPVRGTEGKLVGVVVINMDIRDLLAPLRAFIQGGEKAFLVDDRGNFLLTPNPDRAFGAELGHPYRLKDAFPEEAAAIASTPPSRGGFFRLGNGKGRSIAYVASRAFPTGDPGFRLDLILTESAAALSSQVGMMRRESLVWMGALLLAATLLVALMVRGLTRSLRSLVKASEAIAAGEYGAPLPEVVSGEVGALTGAFRRMADEVKSRERALAELNADLEQRVEERTLALRRQHELQRLILENIGDGVVVADKDGRFLMWNSGAARIVDTGPRDIAPEKWPEQYGVYRSEAGDLMSTDELPLVRAMRGEATEPTQLYLRRPGTKRGRWVTATGRPLLGPDNTVEGGVITLIDITAQKQLQRRLVQNRDELARVGRLALTAEIAAAAAHQLSQPIAAMATYASAAERLHQSGRLSEERLAEILGDMTRVAARAADTLDSLRTLIRRRKVTPVRVEVNELVASSLLFLDERLVEDNVAVIRELRSNLPALYADPVELEQMLIQLLVNAIDALQGTPRDQRHLIVSTSQDPVGNRIIIRVVDSGEGIAPPLADRLFEPWVTSRTDALGIGLSIARTVVENHGGKIGVEVKDSPGAVFKIELPAIVST